ncbi:MAG: SDR family NAD(P)-dependent oxidoreductase [Pseudomonadales bacterium]|nr:SDR family NAD(P)-dependent oxidoreductase [Pseudomonadales bacterium]NIX09505.1 SDR family NAD(P)-dependent oxidoreductase [Pseudomonadales bacterium]
MEKHRTALVTGASAGIGKAFADALAEDGVNLVLVARRADRLEQAASSLRAAHGIEVTTITADLSDPAAPVRIFEETQRQGLMVDYLINNAGVAGPDLLAPDTWQANAEFHQLMMIAPAHLCHLYVPAMRARRWGRIVNVASVAARIPRAGGCNYGPAKAYLVALSEELALTLKPEGIKVCALCPGFTHTEFHNEGPAAELKASTPSFVWYETETVVREGLRALERGRSVYVSGRLYRWIDPLFQSVWTRRLFKVPAR